MLDGEINGALHLVGIGDVRPLEPGGATECACQLLACVDVDIGDDDLGAFLNEELDRGLPDAAGAAGDDGDLAVELTRHLGVLDPVVGNRVDAVLRVDGVDLGQVLIGDRELDGAGIVLDFGNAATPDQ